MPKKPTSPFGYIAFSKDGRVRREMAELSSHKATQETEALARFVSMFNASFPSSQITGVQQLPENDHDFAATVVGSLVHIQLTELVDRTYTFPMTEAEYKAGKWRCAVHYKSGAIPKRLDATLRDQALANVIEQKVAKRYAEPKTSALWLVVFTTAHYLTEYMSSGTLQISEGLKLARDLLARTGSSPFTEVWFTDLQTRPVKVWPVEDA